MEKTSKGVACLWRDGNYFGQKTLTRSDRNIAVKIKSKQNQSFRLLIRCVYLPTTNNSYGEFKKVLEDLELFWLTRKSMGETIIFGDFNAYMHDKRLRWRIVISLKKTIIMVYEENMIIELMLEEVGIWGYSSLKKK